jgi:hypothetical protein
LQLESTPGEGSTFYYDLPIMPVNDKDVEEMDKAPVINTTGEAPVSHSEAFTVLVAERQYSEYAVGCCGDGENLSQGDCC